MRTCFVVRQDRRANYACSDLSGKRVLPSMQLSESSTQHISRPCAAFKPVKRCSQNLRRATVRAAARRGHADSFSKPARLTKPLKLKRPAAKSAEVDRSREIAYLKGLIEQLQRCKSADAKADWLWANNRVRQCMKKLPGVRQAISKMRAEEMYALLSLPAMGQPHALQTPPQGNADVTAALTKLASTILEADAFYSSLGGMIGYQAKCLELIQENQGKQAAQQVNDHADIQFHTPQGPNLDGINGRQIAAVEAAKGLEALPYMAEIWPLGGAGDRLGLLCAQTGKSIPTAMLPYCGRTLLEGLVRDLQARENLYFKRFGAQHTTPVVIMTSHAKKNHEMVLQVLESYNWFGRGRDMFRVICQPMVPVVSAASGRWILPEHLSPMLKPGGHGAIWKLMLDKGVFTWLSKLNCQAALVRQISNPMAGMDATMLALTGAGYADGRTFGFASCERAAGAAEGVNVLMQRRLVTPAGEFEYAYNVTNVEYTEFERLGIVEGNNAASVLPANTNILYVSLKAAEGAVAAGVAAGGGAALPGLIFNSKKTVTWTDCITGQQCSEPAGRMECTMQNLVDSMPQRFQKPIPIEQHAALNTFVVFNKRRRTTSSAKRKRAEGSTIISQTPDGSFRDLMLNAAELLQRCSFHVPQVGNVEQYLEHGPDFIFLFHPALGPLWHVIAQKLRGGAIAPASELVLEVGEAAIVDLRLTGSLIVEADCIYGRAPSSLDLGHQTLPEVAGQAIRYSESGSEAIQYSRSMPDLAETSSTVIPLHRLRNGSTGRAEFQPKRHITSMTTSASEQLELKKPRLIRFSPQCARVRLVGVVIQNRGVDWENSGNVYWQHKVSRHESVKIILHGQSELEASHVVLNGPHTFEVPDGYKMVVSAAPGGGIRRSLQPLSGRRSTWQWQYYAGRDGVTQIYMDEGTSSKPGQPVVLDPEAPFTYMI